MFRVRAAGKNVQLHSTRIKIWRQKKFPGCMQRAVKKETIWIFLWAARRSLSISLRKFSGGNKIFIQEMVLLYGNQFSNPFWPARAFIKELYIYVVNISPRLGAPSSVQI